MPLSLSFPPTAYIGRPALQDNVLLTETGPDTPRVRQHRASTAASNGPNRPRAPTPAATQSGRVPRAAIEPRRRVGRRLAVAVPRPRPRVQFAGYNFFDGLSPEDIAAAQSPLAGWERAAHDPTVRFNDPLGDWPQFRLWGRRLRRAAGEVGTRPVRPRHQGARRRSASTSRPRRSTSAAPIRSCSSVQYHPDANGGDRTHEGKLQAVVQAYTHLKSAPAFHASPGEAVTWPRCCPNPHVPGTMMSERDGARRARYDGRRARDCSASTST